MRYKKGLLILMMLALVWVIAACNNNTDGNGENTEEGEGNPELPVQGEEVAFPELDLTNLGADALVAEYEGGEVNGEEMARFLALQGFINPAQAQINNDEFRQEAVNFVVMQSILAPQVENDEWSSEQMEQFWSNFEQQYGEEKLEEAYSNLQSSEEQLKDSLFHYFLTIDYFRQQATEEDAQAMYDEYIMDLTMVDVRHILINIEDRTEEEAKEIADDLYAQLQAGADFAELATEHSDDTGSAANGGLIEGFPVTQFVPEFADASYNQEIDEIGEPVQTQFGYHIIRVEDRQTQSFEELSEFLYSQLAEEKLNQYYIETLPDQIIEVHL
ncbi:peptidylprolyl isomerase [Bacillus horti]|uniref:Parvulin-like peptidyl-prolyl isomerase/predicted small secreted protein n=1 Tax=Caldalkalibacillus horti TaxID=77523 RepID=A0ABT9W3D7_9BACI|nr:peptidylprolyl isomerase [Bacillus horti]MDQ0167584.1 parvulin-like peptidyl-prolyl isomerase/predicted small secreted protein [Bacillus horti]